MKVKVGLRLASVVCGTEVIVVRTEAEELDLSCGGTGLIELGAPDAHAGTPLNEPEGEGTRIGKRYVDPDGRVELLCTKPGNGALALDGTALTIKSAKALPSSD